MALILVVDDDRPVRRFVRIALGAHGHEVIEADDLVQGEELCRRRLPDLLIAGEASDDIPWPPAMRVRPRIRMSMARPFSIADLVARVRGALLQDGQGTLCDIVKAAGVSIDFARRVVSRRGKEVRLSAREFDILLCLAANHDHVIPEQSILHAVWGSASAENARRLRYCIRQLRRKLEDYPLWPRLLISEPGVGYRLRTKAH